MNITNEEKLALKDMKPEEIKEILNKPKHQVEKLMQDSWMSCPVPTGPEGEVYIDFAGIYRTKPKKLTVNELYEKVNSVCGCLLVPHGTDNELVNSIANTFNEVNKLITQTEGFNIEGEGLKNP